MVSFGQKINLLFYVCLMSLTLRPIDLQSAKRPGFFFLLRKNCFIKTNENIFFAFFLIPMNRIICISFYNIDWYNIYSIRLHFYCMCNIQ